MNPSARRTALITGGARRVGRHVALHLAERGWDVAVTYRRSARDASALAERVEGLGGECVLIEADFTNPPAAAAHVADIVSGRFARLDLLLHNASLYERGRLLETDHAQLRRLLAVHAETPVLLTQHLAHRLRAAGGSVIVMSDEQLDRPAPAYAAYSLSKAALENAVRSLARELAPEVTVNAISPGVVDWPDDMPADARERYLKRVPLARAGTPRDVANLVEFLCTGGRYITGQIIRLDGGRSLR
jgi:pteridine reductase